MGVILIEKFGVPSYIVIASKPVFLDVSIRKLFRRGHCVGIRSFLTFPGGLAPKTKALIVKRKCKKNANVSATVKF